MLPASRHKRRARRGRRAPRLPSALAAIGAGSALVILLVISGRGDPPAPGNAAVPTDAAPGLLVGVGKHDITGPAFDCGFMGYARLAQRGDGIHMRLWARAFAIASPAQSREVVIVSADLGMIFQAVKQEVVARLQRQFGTIFDERNVLLTATHTHSGPGGHSHYLLYNAVSGGFDQQNFEVVVEGIVAAIVQAHRALQPGMIKLAEGELLGASLNRSREAYLKNPPAEIARYGDEVDRQMTLLRFEDAAGQPIGMLNWFAVHPTNVGNRNTLISGDNKGYASRAFERLAAADGRTVVAAFAQANEGDVSPNLWGTPDGVHDFERMEIIARHQLDKAIDLDQAAREELAPQLDYRHRHVEFAGLKVEAKWLPGGQPQALGRAAVGASTLAGAEDGPGLPLVREGLVYGANWPAFTLVPREQAQHFEKPIVLVTGSGRRPLTPDVLPLQVITIGQLAIVAAPFELTTMVGRRLRETVLAELAPLGVRVAVIAGLSNAYSGYVATREEYAVQHYEGASTHFGPFTASALRHEFHQLAHALATGEPAVSGPNPRDLKARNLARTPRADSLPAGAGFGGLVADAAGDVALGGTARATFWSGHPRHDLQTMASYLEVERLVDGAWLPVADDDDLATTIRWRRAGRAIVAEIEWRPPATEQPGRYRLVHHGHFKDATGIHPYVGKSSPFELKP